MANTFYPVQLVNAFRLATEKSLLGFLCDPCTPQKLVAWSKDKLPLICGCPFFKSTIRHYTHTVRSPMSTRKA
jgi:hypothetical protein